jgi:hypothetical protein
MSLNAWKTCFPERQQDPVIPVPYWSTREPLPGGAMGTGIGGKTLHCSWNGRIRRKRNR